MVLLLLALHGVDGTVPRPPAMASAAMLLVSAPVTSLGDVETGRAGGRRKLAGADEEDEDYGYVDPPPDTNRRGAGAPIPHK